MIYRRTFYTENMNEMDVLIQHTNIDEITTAHKTFDVMKYTKDIVSKKIKNEIDTNIDQEVEIHAVTVEPEASTTKDELDIPVVADSDSEVTFDF
jgi:hypothetical protein